MSNSILLSAQIHSAFTIQQVVFYRDNWIVVGVDKTAPFSMTLDSKQLTNGSHTFFAVVTDTANSTVASPVHTVSISNTTAADLASISLKMTAPQAQATLSGPNSILAVQVSDSQNIVKVVFFRDSYVELGSDSVAPFQISIDSNFISNSTHNFFAIAFDAAGNRVASDIIAATVSNVSAAPEPVVVQAPIFVQAPIAAVPTLKMLAPVVSTGSIALSASASGISGLSKVTFFRDNWIAIGSVTTAPYTLNFSTLGLIGEGHDFFAIATDGTGTNVTSNIQTAFIKVAAPVVVAAPSSTACTPIGPIALAGFDALPAVQSAKIKSGPFVGGYTVERNDSRLNWYFASIALLGFVDRIPNDIKNYMNLYHQSTNPDFSIKDIFFAIEANGVNFSKPQYEANGVGQFSDSDDSYAATILSLSTRYYEVTCDKSYFYSLVPGKNYTVLQALKNIATNNLVNSIWPNGLIHVFQSASVYYIAYTEDNVEAYRGLVDFANMLRSFDDGSAAGYQAAADKVQAAMQNILFVDNLFAGTVPLNKPGYAYFWGNGLSFKAPPEPLNAQVKFYPDAVTQIFPQAYRMNMPQSQYDAGWNFLDSEFPLYTTNAYETDPWVLIGLAAALAGKNELAQKMQSKAETSYQNGIPVPINNWSFHRRIALKLQTGKTY